MRPALFLALLLTGGPALADCDAAMTQADLNQCAAEAAADADADLNAAYRRVTDRLADRPDTRKLLVQSQRAWIAFRDAECAFASSGVDGGSIQPMIVSGCVESLTRARATDLARYLACEEGDLSCPVPPG